MATESLQRSDSCRLREKVKKKKKPNRLADLLHHRQQEPPREGPPDEATPRSDHGAVEDGAVQEEPPGLLPVHGVRRPPPSGSQLVKEVGAGEGDPVGGGLAEHRARAATAAAEATSTKEQEEETFRGVLHLE